MTRDEALKAIRENVKNENLTYCYHEESVPHLPEGRRGNLAQIERLTTSAIATESGTARIADDMKRI